MAVLTSSGVTFGDGSSLASAAPANGAVGSIQFGFYIVTISSPPGDGVYTMSDYARATSISGSSLATDFLTTNSNSAVPRGYSTPYLIGRVVSGRTAISFPSSGINYFNNSYGASLLFGGGGNISSTTTSNTTYTTQAGTWRSMTPFSNYGKYQSYGNQTDCAWYATFWIRTA